LLVEKFLTDNDIIYLEELLEFAMPEEDINIQEAVF